jgi:hypothetical protein
MTLPRTVREVLDEHTTLEVESIDRMYLNVYVPALQYDGGVATFFRKHQGHLFASSVLMAPISKAFVAGIEAFVVEHRLPLITFEKGQRKDEVIARTWRGSPVPRGCSSWARPRRRRGCSGPKSAVTHRPASPTRGS